jgi:adenosine deaminase
MPTEFNKLITMDNEIISLCQNIPKAELHLHIGGAIEAELAYKVAKRNGIVIPEGSLKDLEEKRSFNCLQDFLDSYSFAGAYFIYEQDFSDMVYEYLKKSSTQGLVYAEIFFNPDGCISRGVTFKTLMTGLKDGISRGKQELGVETNLIMVFLKHQSEETCIELLKQSEEFKDDIIGIGMVSTEIGNPPSKFKNLYALAKEMGYKLCIHVGEDCGPEFIEEAIDVLNIDRIDHGFTAQYSETVMDKIAEKKIPLTLCPLSNKMLKICPDLSRYPLRRFNEVGIITTINSDDPAFFGGYVGDNFVELVKELKLSKDEVVLLARNSFKASFLSDDKKEYYFDMIDKYLDNKLFN